jgi:hypothetical protein
MQTLVSQVLAAWRRAEELTETLPVDSPEYAAASKACAELREVYRGLTEAGIASLVEDPAPGVVSTDPEASGEQAR